LFLGKEGDYLIFGQKLFDLGFHFVDSVVFVIDSELNVTFLVDDEIGKGAVDLVCIEDNDSLVEQKRKRVTDGSNDILKFGSRGGCVADADNGQLIVRELAPDDVSDIRQLRIDAGRSGMFKKGQEDDFSPMLQEVEGIPLEVLACEKGGLSSHIRTLEGQYKGCNRGFVS